MVTVKKKKKIWICELFYAENGNERGLKTKPALFFRKQHQMIVALGFLREGQKLYMIINLHCWYVHQLCS